MFAGAIVLEWADSPLRGWTLQLRAFQLCLPEQFECFPGMRCAAAVGGRTDGEAPIADIHLICGTAADEGQRLKGLEC